MVDNKKVSKFGIGLLIGTVLGGLSALFLSPGTGKENREAVAAKVKELKKLLDDQELDKKVKEIFGEVTDEARSVYLETKDLVITKLAELKEAVENIDREKYIAVVEDVVGIMKKQVKREAKEMDKLKEELVKEWNKLKK